MHGFGILKEPCILFFSINFLLVGTFDNYVFYGKPLEYEVRDSKGKVNAKKDWTDETHVFVFKQKITINKDDFDRQDLYENSFKKHTIPGKLCIEGQEYIEFPNIKININSGK